MTNKSIINSITKSVINGIGNNNGTVEKIPTTLTITNYDVIEDNTPISTIVGTYTLVFDESEVVTVDFSKDTNLNGYYEIVDFDILLTEAGFDFLNLGNALPNVYLTTSDNVLANNIITTTLVDDETLLTVQNGTIIEDTTQIGDIVCSFSGSDEDDILVYSFTDGTNTENYYTIDGNNVLLTEAGYISLHEGNNLPNVSITTNTGKTVENEIDTITIARRWYYRPDDLDDYVVIDTAAVRSGQVVSFYAQGIVRGTMNLIGAGGSSNEFRLQVEFSSNTEQMYCTRGSIKIDGVSTNQWPNDGEVHFIELTGTSYGQMNRIFRSSAGWYSSVSIWDMEISGSDSGAFSYALDDGYREDGQIFEGVQGRHGKLYNGQESSWVYDKVI